MKKTEEFSISEFAGIISEVIESGGEFRMYPKGTSMLPLIRQGKDSVVLVKPDKKIKKYSIVFYKRNNGQYVLHRVLRADTNSYVLCGDHQWRKEYGITDKNIIGVVNKIYRKDKCINVTDFKYRVYLFFICDLFILRMLFIRAKGLLFRWW